MKITFDSKSEKWTYVDDMGIARVYYHFLDIPEIVRAMMVTDCRVKTNQYVITEWSNEND